MPLFVSLVLIFAGAINIPLVLFFPAVICSVLVILFSKIKNIGSKLSLGLIGLLCVCLAIMLVVCSFSTVFITRYTALFLIIEDWGISYMYSYVAGFVAALYTFIYNKKINIVSSPILLITQVGLCVCLREFGSDNIYTMWFLMILSTILISAGITQLSNWLVKLWQVH